MGRWMIICIGWCLALTLCAAVDVPVPIAVTQRVQTAFGAAASEHVRGFTVPGDDEEWMMYNSPAGSQKRANRAPSIIELIQAIRCLRRDGDTAQANAYCQVAVTELSSPNIARRALACEFLAWFPVAAIDLGALPQIASLLDDHTDVFPGRISNIAQAYNPQNATPTMLTMGDIANATIYTMTGINFPHFTDFQFWWTENAEHATRYWYWAIRFTATSQAIAHTKNDMPVYDIAMQAENHRLLDAMSPELRLKLLLLAGIEPVAAREVEAPWRTRGQQPPVYVYNGDHFANVNPNEAWSYIATHHLQPQLDDLLNGTLIWPEINNPFNPDIVERLAHTIARLLRDHVRKKDALKLINQITCSTGLAARSRDMRRELVLLALKADAVRSATLALTELKNYPHQPDIALGLLHGTGTKYWDALQPIYAAFDDLELDRFIVGIGEFKTPPARSILRQLFDAFISETHLDTYAGQGKYFNYINHIDAFAEAANALTGKRLFESTLLDAAMFPLPGEPATTQKVEVSPEERERRQKAAVVARPEIMRRLVAFYSGKAK